MRNNMLFPSDVRFLFSNFNQPVTFDFDGMVHNIYMSSGKIICFKCQGRGHIAAQCPKAPIDTHVKNTNTIKKSIK